MWPPDLALADGFVAYGTQHWLAMGGTALATTALAVLLRQTRGGPRHDAARRGVCWGLAVILLAGAAMAQAQRVIAGEWSLQESLPLHLCDIAVFVVAAALIGVGLRNPPGVVWQRLFELAYVWGLGGTAQGIVTPDLSEAFPEPACMRYFVLHGAIVVAVLVLVLGLGMRPQRGTVQRVWLVTLALAVLAMLCNWLLDANYMYLCGPPEHPSLFDLLGPWPWSLASLVVVATLLILLCYTPFWLLNRRQERTVTTGSTEPTRAP